MLSTFQIDNIAASIFGRRATEQELDFVRAIERADTDLLRDAELGRVAMRFVDRAGDYCKEDPAERICDDFHAAMSDVVDRWCAMRGMPSTKYDEDGNLK